MGQYWFIDTLGSLQYGEDVVILPEPADPPSTDDRQGDDAERPPKGFGPTVDVYYTPDVSYASERRLIFQRVEPQGSDYDAIWNGNDGTLLASP